MSKLDFGKSIYVALATFCARVLITPPSQLLPLCLKHLNQPAIHLQTKRNKMDRATFLSRDFVTARLRVLVR